MRELKPMKSLSDIVEEQKLCKKYPYFWPSYLYEKKLWYWQRSHLYLTEKHGTFDGQVELVNSLTDCIVDMLEKGNLTNIMIREDKIQNFAKKRNIKIITFFYWLCIIFDDNPGAAYNPDKSKYDEKNNKFEKVCIYVNANEFDTIEKISSTLVHELTHAYEDFKRYEKKLDWTLSDLSKDDVYLKVNKIYVDNPRSQNERIIAKAMYILNPQESNAFKSEFSTLLDALYEKTTDVSYEEALKQFKLKDVYQSLVEILVCLNNKEFLPVIGKIYREANDNSFSDNKCKKILTTKANKLFTKITETLPKIYFDYIERKRISEGLVSIPIYKGKIKNPEYFWK